MLEADKTKTSISEEREKLRKLLFGTLISFSSPYDGGTGIMNHNWTTRNICKNRLTSTKKLNLDELKLARVSQCFHSFSDMVCMTRGRWIHVRNRYNHTLLRTTGTLNGKSRETKMVKHALPKQEDIDLERKNAHRITYFKNNWFLESGKS